jgi:hypothetical protein
MTEIVGPSSLGLTFAVSSVKAAENSVENTCTSQSHTTPPHTPDGDGISDDVVNLATGQQLPVLSINLERLVGYQPETNDEINSIRNQLVEAMWGRYRQQHGQQPEHAVEETSDNKNDGDGCNENALTLIPPPDFDEQIQELLDAKVARFVFPTIPSRYQQIQLPPPNISRHSKDKVDGDNSSSSSLDPYFVLSYPPKLLTKEDNMSIPKTVTNDDHKHTGTTTWLDTKEVWAEIDRLEVALSSSEHSQFRRPSRRQDQIDEYDETNDNDEEENHYGTNFDVNDKYHDEYDYDDGVDFEEPPSVEFVTRLAQHLRATSRPLLWKHAMAVELQRWIEEESARKAHDDWVQSKRQAKLEHLYSVRETLVHQAQLARDKYTHLEGIRDDQVKQELLQYTRREKARRAQLGSSGNDDIEFLDGFGTSQLTFPDEFQLLGMIPDKVREMQLEEEDDWGTLGESEDGHSRSSSDFESDLDNNSGVDTDGEDDLDSSKGNGIPSGGASGIMEDSSRSPVTVGESSKAEVESPSTTKVDSTTAELEGTKNCQDALSSFSSVEKESTTIPFLRRKERREAARIRKRAARIEAQRKAVEIELREKYTTKALILAQTLLQAMESKVQRVEELLESLQDEVWAEEEDEEDCEPRDLSSDDGVATLDDTNTKLSLLDQVLAMILGALPMEHRCDPQAHFEYVRQEHATISLGWKTYFS